MARTSVLKLAIVLLPLTTLASVQSVTESYTFNPLEHLSGIAPYFQPEDPPTNPAPPQGCNVTRAAYLSRHAAIYANDFDFESYIEPFVMKLKNTTQDWRLSKSLSFLSSYESPIEDADLEDLTQFGELEAFKLGVDLGSRYRKINTPKKVWASTAERTVVTAQSFISGIARKANETQLIQIYEGDEAGANSLTPYSSCPAYSSSAGSKQAAPFITAYTGPIIARFNSYAPAFNFTQSDITGMFELCGYETVIRGSSPFCDLSLFSPDEWLSFEYANDLQYHYNTGYGSPVAGAIGFPWLNATMSLLSTPANQTMTNATTNTTTAAQDLFVSFTHRELPPTVLVALGLYNNSAFSGANLPNATMPSSRVNHQRAWKSSHFLQFLTNVAIEKMECSSFGYTPGQYYRVLVNSAPQALGCDDGPGTSCSANAMTEFVQGRGRMFGNYGEACMVDYGNSTDVLGIYTV